MAAAADVCESVAGEALQPIPLLLYHSVSDDPAPGIASLSVSPDEFRQHMDALVESGRKALTVSDFVDQLRAGSAPERPVLITFDDGFADSLEVAAPELEVRKLPATIYLTTGYVGSPGVRRAPRPPGRMLASGQLAELELAGFEIGAHTQRHPELDVVRGDECWEEISGSRLSLEQHLGHQVRTFAYPYGYFNPLVREHVREAGFDSACAVRNAFSHSADDRWAMARLTVRRGHRAQTIVDWMEGRGARVAPPKVALRTRAWREVRLARHILRRRLERWDARREAAAGRRGFDGGN